MSDKNVCQASLVCIVRTRQPHMQDAAVLPFEIKFCLRCMPCNSGQPWMSQGGMTYSACCPAAARLAATARCCPLYFMPEQAGLTSGGPSSRSSSADAASASTRAFFLRRPPVDGLLSKSPAAAGPADPELSWTRAVLCFAYAFNDACCDAFSFLTCAFCLWLPCIWLALCPTSFSVFSFWLTIGICPWALLISLVHVRISAIPIRLVVLIVTACFQAWSKQYPFSMALQIITEATLY